MHIIDMKMLLFFVNNSTAYSEECHWNAMRFSSNEFAFRHVDIIPKGNITAAINIKI